MFFSGIKINPELKAVLSRLPEDAIVVYTTKYKNDFEYLCYYTCFRLQGLAYPQIGFDYQVLIWQPLERLLRIGLAHILYFLKHGRFQDPYKSGYLRQKLLTGGTSVLPLMGKRDFYRRFVRAEVDPIFYLIETQKETQRPIVLLPLLFFFDKAPPPDRPKIVDILFGSAQKPGKLRRLATLFRRPEKVFFEVSDPLSLPQYLSQSENQHQNTENLSRMLRRELLNQINRHRKTVTGPIPKTPVEMKQNILTSNRLQEFMARYAQRRKISIQKVRKEANVTIDEIASKYNPAFVGVIHGIAEWLLNLLFDEVVFDPDELRRVKRMARKGPIIFIPCHKSHFDSLILSEMLYTNNIPSPHIFAGKNLSFWPMGPLLRRFGAFFVRRTFSGAVFYATVFSDYIRWLLEEGFNLAVFIEGTRSRSGKLLQPQLGMLSILINAFKETTWADLTFEPVFIGYDRVPEEGDYLQEIAGKQKEPENIRQMIRARKILKKRFGKIYLKFADPISLKETLEQNDLTIQGMTSKEQNRVCRDLGNRVFNDINRMGLVTPHAVMASALLSDSKKLVSREELDFRIDTYMAYLTSQQAGLSDSLANDPHGAFAKVTQNYIQRKFIASVGKDYQAGGIEIRYRINSNKRLALEYYKNSCIVFFIPAVFTALSILEKKAFQFSSTDLHNSYNFLQELFANEFTKDPDQPPAYLVRKNLKAFINDGILVPHPTLPDTYNLTSQGFRKLKLFAGFIEPLLVSYWVVLKYFARFPKAYHDKKQRVKKIQSIGLRMLKRKEIERKEALSVINYENATALFTKAGIKGSEDREKLAVYDKAIAGYLSLLS
jgi:glycerol-3-phosphate O-acyltransferase